MPMPIPASDRVLLACLPFIALGLANGLYNEALYARAPAAFQALDATHFIVLPLLALAWLRRGGTRWADLGFRRPAGAAAGARLAALTVVLGVGGWVLYTGLQQAFGALVTDAPPTFGYGAALPDLGLRRLAGVAYFALTAGFAEEFIFRGALWHWSCLRWPGRPPVAAYLLVSAPLFGLIHWENGAHEVLATGVLGVAAGLAYARLGNLWPLIGAHVLIDLIEFGVPGA